MTYYTKEEFVNGITKAFKGEKFLDVWNNFGMHHLGLSLAQEGDSMVLSIFAQGKPKKTVYESFIISMVEVEEKWEYKYMDVFNVDTKSGDKGIQWEFDYGSTSGFSEILEEIVSYFYNRY